VKKEEKWPKNHKVENGETLRSISSKYYGTPDMWKIIYDENQSKIFKGLPKEGEILTIPPPKK
jgi:LysM repeat protein